MPFGTTTLNDGNKVTISAGGMVIAAYTGYQIPQIGFGTGSALYHKDASDSVEQALETGFSHIDTAQIYANEKSVGVGIRQSGLKREELYITTKYDGGDIRQELEKSLKKLGVSYVDLYLIHFPAFVSKDYGAAWKVFEKIKSDGLAKSIGVSNFTVKDLQIILKTAKVVPAVNQVLFHPYNYTENAALLEFSAKHGIVTEAYSSLTPITKTPGGPVDEPIQRAATRIGATPAQVIFSWVRSKGVVIVTTSSKKDRLKEYLAVADLPALTAQEIADIESAGAKGPSPTFMSMQKPAHRVLALAALTLLGLGLGYNCAGVHW